MFLNFIVPFAMQTQTKAGIIELHKKGELFILPAVKEELGIEQKKSVENDIEDQEK